MNLRFEDFRPHHYRSYRSWFTDRAMSEFLGDIDRDWLRHVTGDRVGVELAVMHGRVLVGEVGMLPANQRNRLHFITNLAINPNLRRQGYGRALVDQLVHWPRFDRRCGWACFVEAHNEIALAFFQSCGFKPGDGEPDKDGMIRLIKVRHRSAG